METSREVRTKQEFFANDILSNKVTGDLLSVFVIFSAEFQHRVVLQKIQRVVLVVGRGAKVAIEKFSNAFNVECGGIARFDCEFPRSSPQRGMRKCWL